MDIREISLKTTSMTRK